LAKYGAGGVAGVNLVNAVTRLSPDLLTPLAKEFAGRLVAPDLSERTNAIAEFLNATKR
jgi:non-heme chloroperoxidase